MYKRGIEDMQNDIKKLQRERNNMLDLSPGDTVSLKLAQDFDANDFFRKDTDIGLKIRNLKIRLEIAVESYRNLFE